MKRLEEVLVELRTVERTEVMAWIEAEWVRPETDDRTSRCSVRWTWRACG